MQGGQREEAGLRTELATLALRRGQPAAALAGARAAHRLAQATGAASEQEGALLAVANALGALRRPAAYGAFQRYLTLRDTLLAQDRNGAFIIAQTRFQTAEQQAPHSHVGAEAPPSRPNP
ncbi:MAG: hypothetical protein EOO59_00425 [Hymenobacter sp.]|nr:MAG: hypothetical protein EOO59_00425 [Hymenobacter sp.]